MARPRNTINPGSQSQRTILRGLGGLLTAAALICMVIAFVDFVGSFNSAGPPTKFHLFFIGGPLLFVGLVMLKLGYMGAVARYVAGEAAPVATDTVNYVGREAAPGIRAVASAVREGLAGNSSAGGIECGQCGERNDADASFCDACGSPLAETKCPSCGEENDRDARFCNGCGTRLGAGS